MIRHTAWYVQLKERGTGMEKEELESLFCEKIGLEIGKFKKRILKKNPKEIYERAYYIDCMVCIYEQLLELSAEMEAEVLKCLLVIPDILSFLYGRWLKQEDSLTEELRDCLKKEAWGIQEKYNQIMEKKGEAA